ASFCLRWPRLLETPAQPDLTERATQPAERVKVSVGKFQRAGHKENPKPGVDARPNRFLALLQAAKRGPLQQVKPAPEPGRFPSVGRQPGHQEGSVTPADLKLRWPAWLFNPAYVDRAGRLTQRNGCPWRQQGLEVVVLTRAERFIGQVQMAAGVDHDARECGRVNERVGIHISCRGLLGVSLLWPVSRETGQRIVSSRQPYLLPALDELPTRWISRRFFRCFGHTSLQALNISGARCAFLVASA